MTLTSTEQSTLLKCNIRFSVFIFGLTLFYAVVCTPLFLLFSSNILFEASVLPLLWDVLMGACNYLFYWGSFACLLFMGARFSLKQCKSFFMIYSGAAFFRYIANLLAGYAVMGIPSMSGFLSDLPYLLFDIVMDLVLMAIAALVLHLIVNKTPLWVDADGDMMQSDAPKCSRVSLWNNSKGLYDNSNSLHRTAVWYSIIPAAVQMISRIIYDISYGAPTDALDLTWMIVYYVSDILCALIGYFVILLLLNSLLSRFYKEERA